MRQKFVLCSVLVCFTWICARAQNTAATNASKPAKPTVEMTIKVIELTDAESTQRLSEDQRELSKLLSEKKARIASEVRLTARSNERASIRQGQRVPIQIATLPTVGEAGRGYSSSVIPAAVAVPQIQYENVGLSAEAIPEIESDGSVFVRVNFELSSIEGNASSLTPVFLSRILNSGVTLRPGQTTILALTESPSSQEQALDSSNPATVSPLKAAPGRNYVITLTARILPL